MRLTKKIINKLRLTLVDIVDIIAKYTYDLNPKKTIKLWYFVHSGKSLDLINPQTFDEKLQWLKLYWQHPLIVQCADKYGVRDYAHKKNVSEILNPLYGVYENSSEIDWQVLPEKFVIKTTNSTGTNLICLDKKELNFTDAEELLNKWLKKDSRKVSTERHYKHMKPRIIAEKFIETEDGTIPTDYKFFCFNGRPLFVSVVQGRSQEHLKDRIYKTYFDMSWKQLFLEKKAPVMSDEENLANPPKTFNQMIEYASILSEDFPFVRVDFYEGDSYPILGEMTFTPSGGVANYYKNDVQYYLGKQLNLPNKIISSDW